MQDLSAASWGEANSKTQNPNHKQIRTVKIQNYWIPAFAGMTARLALATWKRQ
jgi:hypothetical protein